MPRETSDQFWKRLLCETMFASMVKCVRSELDDVSYDLFLDSISTEAVIQKLRHARPSNPVHENRE